MWPIFSLFSVVNFWNSMSLYGSLSFTGWELGQSHSLLEICLYHIFFFDNFLSLIFFFLEKCQRLYFSQWFFSYFFFPDIHFLLFLFYLLGDSIFQICCIFQFCYRIWKFLEFFLVLCWFLFLSYIIPFIHGYNNLTSLIYLRIL